MPELGRNSVGSEPREAGDLASVDTGSSRLGRTSRWPIVGMVTTIALLHILGVALLLSAPRGAGNTGPLSIGIGITAYALGLRHAFDADHIAAIDNTTRKLVGELRRPVSVGFWFSLGHSTVVLGLTLALALGAHALAGPIRDERSTLHQVTGVIGATVSGLFLYVIAAINLALMLGAVRTLRAGRSGQIVTEDADAATVVGPMTRIFGRVVRSIRRPRQMYPLGLLFGLGFDTATEVGLLVLAASSAAAGVPWYSLIALPLLFAAGMSLLDTADGLVMRYAYGWAFEKPRRRMHYDLGVTALSVGVAFIVGSIQLVSLIGNGLHLDGGLWEWTDDLDLSIVGLGIGIAFLVVWATAFAAATMSRNRKL